MQLGRRIGKLHWMAMFKINLDGNFHGDVEAALHALDLARCR
jgi:hypothetical protein